jgi:hypothetical protein
VRLALSSPLLSLPSPPLHLIMVVRAWRGHRGVHTAPRVDGRHRRDESSEQREIRAAGVHCTEQERETESSHGCPDACVRPDVWVPALANLNHAQPHKYCSNRRGLGGLHRAHRCCWSNRAHHRCSCPTAQSPLTAFSRTVTMVCRDGWGGYSCPSISEIIEPALHFCFAQLKSQSHGRSEPTTSRLVHYFSNHSTPYSLVFIWDILSSRIILILLFQTKKFVTYKVV